MVLVKSGKVESMKRKILPELVKLRQTSRRETKNLVTVGVEDSTGVMVNANKPGKPTAMVYQRMELDARKMVGGKPFVLV